MGVGPNNTEGATAMTFYQAVKHIPHTANLDDFHASQLIRELAEIGEPRPAYGLAVLSLYGAFLGLFVYWVTW
jgi:hypothetical protein